MQISTNFRQMPSSQPLRDYAESKITKLEKYYNGILDVKVTFSTEKTSQTVEVTLKANGITIRGEDSASDAYAALDNVVDKLSAQLKKHHDKMKGHQLADSTKEMNRIEVMPRESREAGETPQIIPSRSYPLKPMFPDDAAMRLEQIDDDFLVFINADTTGVNVIYRRRDGNYGLVEPDR